MSFPIFKSRDADNVRVYAEASGPDSVRFTRTEGSETVRVYELSGDEAEAECARLRAADAISFADYFSSAR
jgi:hypothetical protein